MQRRSLLSLIAGLSGAFGATAVVAQDFPNRPVRIVVANPVGSAGDMVARLLIPELSRSLGQPVIVEPKPGADQRIGALYVAKQVPADGHTLAVLAVTNLASIPALVKDAKFAPLKDLVPVTTLVSGRVYLVTSANGPWRNFEEFSAYVKANPGKLNYGSTASSTRLRLEAVLQARGLNIVHVPYATTGAAEQALLAGQVQLMIGSDAIVANRERVRALAVTGQTRYARFPDIPTFAELGLPPVPGAEYSLSVPLGTPKYAFDRLQAATSRALQSPEFRSQMERLGFEVVNDSPEAAAQNLAAQAKLVADVAGRIGIQPE